MPVVSIRFSDEPLHARLKSSAERSDVSISSLAERLIDEGLRMRAHPAVVFRDGTSGRRAALAGGPAVVEVIGAIVGGDVPADERRSRASDFLGIPTGLVDAAIAYYAEYPEEIDEQLARREVLADELEAAWSRQRAVLEQRSSSSTRCTRPGSLRRSPPSISPQLRAIRICAGSRTRTC